jgi:hypothetical protein
MFKCFIRSPLALLSVVCLVSCSSANNKPVLIGFSSDSTSIEFRGIDPAGLLQVRNTPHIDTAYSNVISVVQVPLEADSTGIELPVPGKVRVTDSMIIFHPSMPLVHGRDYLVISYLNARFGNPAMIFSGKLNHNVKPRQVILKR